MNANRRSVAVGLLAGTVGMVGSYAAVGNSVAYVGAPVTSAVINWMPAPIVTFSILYLGKGGEYVAHAIGFGVGVSLLALLCITGLMVGDRTRSRVVGILSATVLTGLFAFFLTRSYPSTLGTVVTIGGFVAATELIAVPGVEEEPRSERRYFLQTLGLASLFSLPAYALGTLHSTERAIDGANASRRDASERLAVAEEKALDFANEHARGLVTERDLFYQVDIAAVPPEIALEDWELTVTGEIANEFSVTYDELREMEPERRFITLRCVGDPVNGGLMDNALWTGVPIKQFVDRAVPRGECNCVMLRAADDYYEEFPLAALREGFLAYRMNGDPLPRDHGAPVRALIPGHWGEINVKWLTDIEILQRVERGYWEKRGWHGTGPVNTVAKLWEINTLSDGRMQVGGHAYAGTRGVKRVEVSVDGGDTWADAVLSDPLDGDDVWRQWKYEWQPTAEEATVVVRATDGERNLQPRERDNPYPSGATGWVSKTIGTGST